MKQTKPWYNKEIELLKSLWAQGITAEQIAQELGRTKNGICGKVRRLNLPVRQIRVRVPKVKVLPVNIEPERKDGLLPPLKREEIAKKAYGHGVTPLERKSCECLWPIGDPRHKDFHFCGAKVHAKNYCEAHYFIGYRRSNHDIKKTG